MPSFFVEPDKIYDGKVIISGEDVKHITKVLRLGPGDGVTVLDGQGMEYQAILEEIGSDRILASITGERQSQTEPPLRVTLIQGLPKGEKMELIIQKAVELGVHRIIPVETTRSIVKLDAKKALQRQERWQRIAMEAAKQSKRGIIPNVEVLTTLNKALKGLSADASLVLMPWEEASAPLKPLLESKSEGNQEIYIIIGPEGGFTQQEAQNAIDAGAYTVSLGPRILRTETAGFTVLAVVMYELGDLGGGVNG